MLNGGRVGIRGVGDGYHVPVRTEVFAKDGVVWLANLSSLRRCQRTIPKKFLA